MSKLNKPDDVLDGVHSPADRKRLRAVLAYVEEMREAEAAFRAQQAQRREKLQGVATACLTAVHRVADRIHIGRHLYWHVHEVSATTIAEAWRVRQGAVVALIGALETTVQCAECGAGWVVTHTSRQGQKSSKAQRHRCEACIEARRAQLEAENTEAAA